MVKVLVPDDGQGWIKVRVSIPGGSIEGLIPAGYVEVQARPPGPIPSNPSLHSPQQIPPQSNASAPQHMSPPRSLPPVGSTMPVNSSPPGMPGSFSALTPSPPVTLSQQSTLHNPYDQPSTAYPLHGTPQSDTQQQEAPPAIPGNRPAVAATPSAGQHGQIQALYDYHAAESDEFTLAKGQVYNLSARGASYDAGWWELVDVATGRVGIAPSNYMKRI